MSREESQLTAGKGGCGLLSSQRPRPPLHRRVLGRATGDRALPTKQKGREDVVLRVRRCRYVLVGTCSLRATLRHTLHGTVFFVSRHKRVLSTRYVAFKRIPPLPVQLRKVIPAATHPELVISERVVAPLLPPRHPPAMLFDSLTLCV